MKTIYPNLPERFKEKGLNNSNMLSGEGFPIESFAELRLAVAELSCLNPDSMLFFRGQHTDHKRKFGIKGEASTFFPSIYRGNPNEKTLRERWQRLELATSLLNKYLSKIRGTERKEFSFLRDKRLAQWSVLQHYEIVETPLLDLTQSLRVACSFAELGRTKEDAYIYVFALPYPTGRISINSEQYLTNIRLLSVIPSIVRRPHNQEGYLVCEDDIEKSYSVMDRYDWRRRAVAKFKIHLGNPNFWGDPNGLKDRPLSEKELYPDKNQQEKDPLYDLCKSIKEDLNTYLPINYSDNTGHFLSLWRKIESYLLGYCREMKHDLNPTVSKAFYVLGIPDIDIEEEERKDLISELRKVRRFRNDLVHSHNESVNISEGIFLANKVVEMMEKHIPGIKNMAILYENEKIARSDSNVQK